MKRNFSLFFFFSGGGQGDLKNLPPETGERKRSVIVEAGYIDI